MQRVLQQGRHGEGRAVGPRPATLPRPRLDLADQGDEALGGLWAYLDITALGRQEDWEDSPEGYPQSPANVWIRRHDEYDSPAGSEAAEAMAVQVERGRAAGQTKSSG